jgi:DNA-binding beta-propeller fold protein YncE
MKIFKFTCVFFSICLFVGCTSSTDNSITREAADAVPSFQVDPFWPQTFPDNWITGQVSGIAVDSKNHIWIVHRPGTLGLDEGGPDGESQKPAYSPAPPVMEFDSGGKMLQSWGGPGEGYEWPVGEHGIFVDGEDNVWICAANGKTNKDHHVLKFKSDGSFLLQIGIPGETGGSNDTLRLGRPTDIAVDQAANEVYITDGYLNRRLIVFDSNTGEYKRHWGAYGNKPEDVSPGPYDPDLPPPQQFDVPHAVIISDEGLVYLCDRSHNRIQVFQKNGKFIFEEFVARNTSGLGSTWDIDFSHDPGQKYIYVADGTNQCVWILERENLKTVSKFGRIGRYAGEFIWVHSIAADSFGNIYTGEVYTGKRTQKFSLKRD